MQYQIKAFKSFRGMEGKGYNATLCRDGKPVAFVIDEGNGGEVNFHWEDFKAPRVDVIVRHYQTHAPTQYLGTPEEALFAAYVMALPQYEFYGKSYHNFDTAMGELVQKVETEKQYIRWCKTSTVFHVKGDKEGEFRTMKMVYSPKAKAVIIAKYGNQIDEILNEKYGVTMDDTAAEELRLRKLCAKGIVVHLKGKPVGSCSLFKLPYNAANKARVMLKFGAEIDEIINERFAA